MLVKSILIMHISSGSGLTGESQRDVVNLGWPIAPRIWAIDWEKETERGLSLAVYMEHNFLLWWSNSEYLKLMGLTECAIIGCVQLCAWSPIKLWWSNSLYLTYGSNSVCFLQWSFPHFPLLLVDGWGGGGGGLNILSTQAAWKKHNLVTQLALFIYHNSGRFRMGSWNP